MKSKKAKKRLFKDWSQQFIPSDTPTIASDSITFEMGTAVVGQQLEQKILSDDIEKLTCDAGLEIEVDNTFSYEEKEVINNPVDELNSVGQQLIDANDQAVPQGVHKLDQCETEAEEMIEVDTPPSLLENARYIKLVEECVDIMNEFESYTDRMETGEGKEMTKMIVRRLQESLERSGLERIDDKNEPFSILKHKPEPMMPIAEGEALSEVLIPGLAIENRVFRKAKVTLKQD